VVIKQLRVWRQRQARDAEHCCTNPHFSQICRPDRANPMPAGTSVAISDAVGSQAVTISTAGLRCSGNDLRPGVRPTVRNPGSAGQWRSVLARPKSMSRPSHATTTSEARVTGKNVRMRQLSGTSFPAGVFPKQQNRQKQDIRLRSASPCNTAAGTGEVCRFPPIGANCTCH